MTSEHKKELFETAPILTAIMKLGIPSVIGQIILVIYNIADTFFIGMTKSDSMITAVTVCMPAFMFLSAVSNLFGVGGASVISRALGRRDDQLAVDTTRFAVWGCLVVTLIYLAGVFFNIDPFVNLLGGSHSSVHEFSKTYMLISVVIGGLPTALNTLLSHLMRAEGYSFQAGIGVAAGGVLNILLDPLFMFVLLPAGNEVAGAAIATAISNFSAFLYYVVFILKNNKKLYFSVRLSLSMFRDRIPSEVFRVGIPACLMTLCENISYAVLDNLMSAAGTAAQAGIGVAKKINMLSHSVVRGMTQGVLPIIGYNYSSGNHGRMRKTVLFSGSISLCVSLICMILSLTVSTQLVGIFIPDQSDSLFLGARFLKILCLGAPFSTFAYTVISFFQAVGQGFRSLILALLRKGLLDLPLMFLLNRCYPPFGILWATPGADFFCCVTALILFCTFFRRNSKTG